MTKSEFIREIMTELNDFSQWWDESNRQEIENLPNDITFERWFDEFMQYNNME